MSIIKKPDKRLQITDISYMDTDGVIKVVEGALWDTHINGPPHELLGIYHDPDDTIPFMLIRRDRIVKVVLAERIKKELGIE